MSNTKNFSQCKVSFSAIGKNQGSSSALRTLALLAVLLLSPAKIAIAQITPDATLGNESSRVTPANLIEGGAQRGSSLFHSFSEFNVNNLQSVYFANPSGINNIFSRVTGNNVSHILGTLGVNGTANLYLLNPNGIIFGKDAQLDIKGAFFASTANSFIFPGGNEFSATNPQMPLLKMSVPVGVQFGSQPGDISSQGNLEVGKDLTFSAENVNLEGQLQAQTATLEASQDLNIGDYTGISLGGKAGGNINYGKIEINNTDPNITPSNPSLLLNAVGTITGSGNISTTIPELFVDLQAKDNINIKDISTKGGGINITSDNGDINTQSLDSSSSSDSGTAAGNGGGMTLTAGGNIETQSLYSYSFSSSGTAGNGGGMTLTAGGDINTQSLDSSSFSDSGTANGGGMTLTAGGNINTQSLNSSSSSYSGNVGNGGAIALNATGGNITTQSLNSSSSSYSGNVGNGGAIALNATAGNITTQSLNSSSFSNSGNVGNGGEMTLTAGGNIETQSLNSSSSSDSGTAGNGVIKASGDVSFDSYRGASLHILAGGSVNISGNVKITGKDTNNFIQEAIILSNGKTLNIDGSQTPTLDIRAGVKNKTELFKPNISAGFTPNLPIISAAVPTTANITIGNITNSGGLVFLTNQYQPNSALSSGNITVSRIDTSGYQGGGRIYIDGRGEFSLKADLNSSSLFSNPGGNITILAGENITLDGSKITSDTFGSGNGGNILIKARSLNLENGGQIASVSQARATGNSGNITINVSDNISLISNKTSNTQDPSAIFTLVQRNYPDSLIANSSKGNGGNILITTGNLNLKDGSEILSNNFGNQSGTKAGDISIYARDTITLDGYRNNNNSYSSSSIASNIRWGAEGGSTEAKQAGNIDIEAANLKILNGGSISSRAETKEIGNAGNITIKITKTEGSVLISGSGGTGTGSIPSGIFNTVESPAKGNGGFIDIKTGNW